MVSGSFFDRLDPPGHRPMRIWSMASSMVACPAEVVPLLFFLCSCAKCPWIFAMFLLTHAANKASFLSCITRTKICCTFSRGAFGPLLRPSRTPSSFLRPQCARTPSFLYPIIIEVYHSLRPLRCRSLLSFIIGSEYSLPPSPVFRYLFLDCPVLAQDFCSRGLSPLTDFRGRSFVCSCTPLR